MIFKPKLARAITRGKKTQTRRPVKWLARPTKLKLSKLPKGRHTQAREYVDADHPGPKTQVPCRYLPQHDYALQQGRGIEAMKGVRLLVTSVRQERVSEISFEDARAEGFRTRQDFFGYWRELYGDDADMQQLVWVISFQPTFEDRYMTDNRDPAKGPIDFSPTPPATGGMKHQGQAVPAAYEELLARETDAERAWRQEQHRLRAEKIRYESKLNNARRRGAMGVIRRIEVQVRQIQGYLDEAA